MSKAYILGFHVGFRLSNPFHGTPKEQIQFNPKAEFLGGVDSEQKGLLACLAKQVLHMMIPCRVSDFVSHIIQISMVSIEN